MNQEIGFIGLGAMGAPMASSLIDAGYVLRVYNRTAARAESLIAMGAVRAQNPADAAKAGGIAITMVADDDALREVTLGAQGIAEGLGRGGIHLSMSTVAPGTSRRLAEEHAKRGGAYVGAPVFGRPDAAKAKKLWVLQSGPAQAKSAARPLIEAMGQGIFDFGEDPGAANVAKLVGNFLIAA